MLVVCVLFINFSILSEKHPSSASHHIALRNIASTMKTKSHGDRAKLYQSTNYGQQKRGQNAKNEFFILFIIMLAGASRRWSEKNSERKTFIEKKFSYSI